MEYPRYYWNPNYEPWLPADIEMPKAGESLPPRHRQGDLRPLLLRRRPDARRRSSTSSSTASRRPSCRRWCWSSSRSAGGTGSGMVVDLARHLSNVKLGRRIPVDRRRPVDAVLGRRGARGRQRRAVPDDERARLHARRRRRTRASWRSGATSTRTRSPVASSPSPQEHSWQRLGVLHQDRRAGGARERCARVSPASSSPTRSCASSCRTTAACCSSALRPAGFTGAPHETQHLGRPRNWTVFDVAKYSHPGCRGAAGRAGRSGARSVASGSTTSRSGPASRTASRPTTSRSHTVASRELWNDTLENKLKETLSELPARWRRRDANRPSTRVLRRAHRLREHHHPRRREDRLHRVLRQPARRTTRIEDWDEKLMMHAWLLDLGVMLSRAVDPLRRDGRRVHLGVRLLGRRPPRCDPRVTHRRRRHHRGAGGAHLRHGEDRRRHAVTRHLMMCWR